MTEKDFRQDAKAMFWVVLRLEWALDQLEKTYGYLIDNPNSIYFYQLSKNCNFVNAKQLCGKVGVGSRAILAEIERLDPDRLVKPIADATKLKLQKHEASKEIKEEVRRVIEKFERNLRKQAETA